MLNLAPLLDALLPALVDLRHELHANPELSSQEHETAGRISDRLAAIPGLKIRTGVAGTGIVAVLGAGRPGPCVALRADMDALPIREETGLPYASKRPGVMHACGHDGHVTCLVGAAQVLAQIPEELPGPVKFIFQPAEEGEAGGKQMCEEGALEDPTVAAAFAPHAWPSLHVGTVGSRSGPALASTDTIEITVHGAGSHAASPHKGVDPILIAAQIVVSLQSVVSRSLPPVEPAVVTIGQIEAGTASNIIPETAFLRGTIRTLDAETRQTAVKQVARIARGTAEAFGGRADVAITADYPVLVNHPGASAYFSRVAKEVLGEKAVFDNLPPSLGAEDFAYYTARVPGVLWRLGVRPAGAADMPTLHNPRFDFSDAAIPVGVRMHCELVRRFPANGV